MARKRPSRPQVILPPDLDYDDDQEIAGGGIPDENGWVYLQRDAKPDTKARPNGGRDGSRSGKRRPRGKT